EDQAAAELREMAKACWANDKDLALKYARSAAMLEPRNPESSELLLSFGLDPAEFGVGRAKADATRTGPMPPPVPSTIPPSIMPSDIAPSGNAGKTTRDDVVTLPPESLIELDDDDDPLTQATPSRPVAAIADEVADFDLSAIDEILELDPAPPQNGKVTDTQEFAALFDLDDDDIDSLFNEELITGTFTTVSDDFGLDPFAPIPVDDEDEPDLSPDELESLQEDLAEVDFYKMQGLLDEARAVLTDLRARFGNHPLIEDAATRVGDS